MYVLHVTTCPRLFFCTLLLPSYLQRCFVRKSDPCDSNVIFLRTSPIYMPLCDFKIVKMKNLKF